MNVTVAVCSRDRPADLAGCLTSLAGSLREGDELLVVDSASRTDDTAAVARGAGAALVRVDRPGLSRARNAALAHAGHEVVAFTDDDCRPDAGWVAAIAAAFAAEPDAGTDLAPATTGDADRGLGFLTGRVTAHGGGAPVVLLLDDSPHRIDATTPLEEIGHGANMAVRVAAARALGGFDERLGAGARFRAGEDTDLFRRLLAAGWHGRYEPAAAVAHGQWRSRPQALRASYGYGIGFGAVAAKARAGGAGPDLYRRGVGHAGLGHAVRDLRAGYPFGALVCLCWTAGVVAGHARMRRADPAPLRAAQPGPGTAR